MTKATLVLLASALALPATVLGCDEPAIETHEDAGDADGGASDGGAPPVGNADGGGGAPTQPSGGEQQPEPESGAGFADPLDRSLHGHGCDGTDWQLVGGWLLLPHAAPDVGPADEMARCEERYAGWVTHEADDAGVSRASVYAALAASAQCDADTDYDGAMLPATVCAAVHPELSESECIARMAEQRQFGIATVASAIALGKDAHHRDIPLVAAYLSRGQVACGGTDRWGIDAEEAFIDRYVAAFNAFKAEASPKPACKKRIVVSVALYTGMDDPGADGIPAANGCWTYERVSKQNDEWKICNYDGTVKHPSGVKWAYDDTNSYHAAGMDSIRIHDCMEDVPGRGYVYMTNRGYGWPKGVTSGVAVHFAEIYSGQSTVDDQYDTWVSAGTPGQPMVNFGEASTSTTKIRNVTQRACKKVGAGGYFGVYVYPESLRGNRMSSMIRALNACTAAE